MEREEGREGLDKEVEGETPLTTTTTMTSGITKQQPLPQELRAGDPGFPQGTLRGLPRQQAFCQFEPTGLWGQFGQNQAL